jgi:hypothetical protein
MIKAVTLYARVSSERQVRQAMRASQLAVLRARVAADDLVVLPSDEYVDDGHRRSTLRCPARDRAAQGAVDTLYLDPFAEPPRRRAADVGPRRSAC